MRNSSTTAVLMGVVVALIAGPALAQTEWVEYEGNPVIPAPDPAVWNHRYTSSVVVVEGTYHLYFARQPVDAATEWGDYEVCHATSTDGLDWQMDPANPILSPDTGGGWHAGGLGPAAVIHDGSSFHMWFAGGDGESVQVGYATSADGSAWTEYDGNPVLETGPSGSFDDGWAVPETVIVRDGLYRLWFGAAKDVGPNDYEWTIGYAESSDGLEWVKHPGPVLEPGAGWDDWLVYAPSVIYDGAGYHMWYSGTDGTGANGIGYAVSADGIVWVKHLGNPVLGFSDGVDAHPVVLEDAGDGGFEMWFTSFDSGSEGEFGFATSQCCTSLAYLSVVPAAGYAAGAEGSFYRTDLDLSNRSDSAVEYELWWLPRGEDNAEHVVSERFTLAVGRSVRYANVLAEVFGLEPDALGAVAIGADSPELLAMARIYTQPEAESAGTYGQAMPAIGPDGMIHSGERRRILFGTEHADMRTNIGCQNWGGASTPVQYELFDSEGTSLDSSFMVLEPWSNQQLNRIFDGFQPVLGYVEVWTPAPNHLFYCYGSVLDNETNDPTTIPPQ
jgi:predicted GH43/DUF377 family glycosyl hydrolase